MISAQLISYLKETSADILLIGSGPLSEEYTEQLGQVFEGTCIALTDESEEEIPGQKGGCDSHRRSAVPV